MKKYKHYLFDWGDTLMVDFPSEDGPMYKWSKVEAVEGADKLLSELSSVANCYVATNAKASSKDDIRKALSRVLLDKYIKDVFCYQSIGFEKPSKEFFYYILASLNADKNEIVMIGDGLEKDILGAIDFGFEAIWINTRKQPIPEGINSVDCLLQILNL